MCSTPHSWSAARSSLHSCKRLGSASQCCFSASPPSVFSLPCGSARPCRPTPSTTFCRCYCAHSIGSKSGAGKISTRRAPTREPIFAVDHGFAQRWWVKPLLKLTRAMPLDPARPLATRTLIHAVRSGETLVIFPEGRITVTGQLMKVYDGAALIAEKSGAMVVPVRIEGLEVTIFSRLSRTQVRRRWFPKVRVTVLEPVRLAVDDALKGKARRQAAGAMLYQIMSDLIFRTTPTDRTVLEAIVDAAKIQGWGRVAVEDPVTGKLNYRKLLVGARVLAGKFTPLAGEGEALGVMLPNANGAAATLLGMMSAGRAPAMINFTAGAANIQAACTAAEVRTIVTSRGFVERARLDKLVDTLAEAVRVIYLEDVRGTVSIVDKTRALLAYRR